MIDLQFLYLGHHNKNAFCQIMSKTETEESGGVFRVNIDIDIDIAYEVDEER